MNNQSNSEMIKATREFRDAMTADTAIIEIAKIISGMADRLDVTTAALREMTKQRDELAAENVALKQSKPSLKSMMSALDAYYADEEVPESAMLIAFNILRGDIETPATDAAIAEMQAQNTTELVKALSIIANSEEMDGDTVVCDFSTLVSVAAGALRVHYNKQPRKGAAV